MIRNNSYSFLIENYFNQPNHTMNNIFQIYSFSSQCNDRKFRSKCIPKLNKFDD